MKLAFVMMTGMVLIFAMLQTTATLAFAPADQIMAGQNDDGDQGDDDDGDQNDNDDGDDGQQGDNDDGDQGDNDDG